MAAPAFTVDTRELDRAAKQLVDLTSQLAHGDHGVRLHTAGGQATTQLIANLKRAAGSSQTPQAAIVADSIRAKPGGVGLVIGGAQAVGSRGTAAGVLVWGSEHGGDNFGAPRGGSYWIAPTVDGYARSGATGPYLAALNAMLRDAGLL